MKTKFSLKNGVCKRFSARIITKIFQQKLGKNKHWTTFCKPGARCKYKTGRHNREMGDWSSHATLTG